jgi:hypothetical protein
MKPEVSIGTGLATAVIVWAVHQQATPTAAEMRLSDSHDADLDSARRQASWIAAGIVAGISLIAKDATVFIIGGSMVVILDWWTRHANEVDPTTGRATSHSPTPDPTMEVTDPTAYAPA